ncbi:hypothetical protein MC885_010141 [Smutsia gigantea]|nr:hypothetical protein MC885_010141 [Smutsia gigantea]
MAVTDPATSGIQGSTRKASTLQKTLSSPDRDKDRGGSIFAGFAGLLAILLLIAMFCILWNWNKWKKWRVPFRVTNMALLTLPRPRQQAKNIYDLLPRRQEELERHQSSSIRVFSTESLLSRNSDSPPSEYMPSQAGSALWMHRAHTHAMGYAVGLYNHAVGPQLCGSFTPSALYVNVRATRDCPSISSEDSRDYVNVPPAEEIAKAIASSNSSPGNFFVLPSAQESAFTEEKDKDAGNPNDCTPFWSPETKSNDPLSDGEGSQTSNDYVNMAGLDIKDTQGKQPCVAFPCCRDYETVPSADLHGSQPQSEGERTSSNTDRVEGRTEGPGTQVVMQSGSRLALGDSVACQLSAQSGNSQMKHGEEMSKEDSNDYENVLTAKLGGRDSGAGFREQGQTHSSFQEN